MYVEGMEDAEGDWIGAARAIVGEDCPISTSYDLHGNVSQRIIDAIDMFSTYRTAPHIDVEETMRRAVTMLVRSLQEKIRPILLWVPIPVLLPGERTSTEDEPAKSLYARLPELDTLPGVWDASLMVGYVWADEPRATAAAIFTGTDGEILEREAKKIATSYWQVRHDFTFGSKVGSIEECVAQAINSPTHPVILADSGDNPTGGGVGDRGDVLRELLRQKAQNVIVAGITDAPAVTACFAAGEGNSLDITVGASLDKTGSEPLRVRASVCRLYAGTDEVGSQAVVKIDSIHLVLCTRRRAYHNISDFTALGFDITQAKILLVKSGYLSPDLKVLANPNLMILSPGVVDQFVERLKRNRKLIPTFPFDQDIDFVPEVRYSRRSLGK